MHVNEHQLPMHYISGQERNQIQILCLEQIVEKDSFVRVIDAFVDLLENKVKPLIEEFLATRGSQAAVLIRNLNRVITGWANYHKHACSKNTFFKLDKTLWRNIWNWARRRHNKLSYRKIVSLLFMTIGNRKWQFFGKFSNGKTILLRMFALFKIRRHKRIAGAVNPFDLSWDKYIRKRQLCRISA